jgi:hypothetical protein
LGNWASLTDTKIHPNSGIIILSDRKHMIERIKSGTKPTEIFREIFSQNLELSNYELAQMFESEFQRISSEAIQSIWYWKSGRAGQKGGGFNDDDLNTGLILWLQEAGYLQKDHFPPEDGGG